MNLHIDTVLIVYLFDLKDEDFEYAADAIAYYLMEMYALDKEMQKALKRYFAAASVDVYDRIKDTSVIARLNHSMERFPFGIDQFYDYISGNTLHTKKLNFDVNVKMPLFIKAKGEEICTIPYEYFADTIKARFSDKYNPKNGKIYS